MLREDLIQFDQLEHFLEEVMPFAPQADILPDEFRAYFEEVRRRIASGTE